jgi:hypothetical protein
MLQVCEGSHSVVSCDLWVTALTKLKKKVLMGQSGMLQTLFVHKHFNWSSDKKTGKGNSGSLWWVLMPSHSFESEMDASYKKS